MSFFASLPGKVQRLARSLHETKAGPLAQIALLVDELGYEEASRLSKEAQQTQIPTPDGKRNRTPGGVFFYLAKQRVTPEVWARITAERQAWMQRWLAEVASPVTWFDSAHRQAIAAAVRVPVPAEAVNLRGNLPLLNKIISPSGRQLALANQPWPPDRAFLRNMPLPPLAMRQRRLFLLSPFPLKEYGAIKFQGIALYNQRLEAMVAIERMTESTGKKSPSLLLHLDICPRHIQQPVVIDNKLAIIAFTVQGRYNRPALSAALAQDIIDTYIAHFPRTTWDKVKRFDRVTITGAPVWNTDGQLFLLAQSVVNSHKGNAANIRRDEQRVRTAKKLAHVS